MIDALKVTYSGHADLAASDALAVRHLRCVLHSTHGYPPSMDEGFPWMEGTPIVSFHTFHRRYFPTNSDTIHGWHIPSIDGDPTHR